MIPSYRKTVFALLSILLVLSFAACTTIFDELPPDSSEPAASSEPPADSSEPPASSDEPPASSDEPTTDSSEPTASSSEPTTDSSESTTDSSEPTASSDEPTTDSSEPPASSDEPTADSSEPTASSGESTASSGESTASSSESTASSGESAASSGDSGGGDDFFIAFDLNNTRVRFDKTPFAKLIESRKSVTNPYELNLDAKAGPASEYSIRIFAVGATEAGWESRDFTVTFISDYGHLSGDQKRLVITDDGRISGIFSATFDNMEVYTEGLPGQASGWILQRGVIRLQLTREEEEVDPEITDTLEAKMDPYPKGYSWEPPQQVNAYKFRQDPKLFRVGSANIEIFGTTKQKRYNTHTVLASMATNFDILAIQEVGSNGNPTEATATTVMNNYVARVNELAPPELGVYSYVRHHQYAFVYRKDIVVATAAQSYNDMPGATHQFTYPPLVAKFTSRSGLDFALMTVHTSPDKAKAEIMYIPDALNELKTVYEVQRVGCLGDYNGDGSYYTAGSKAQGWLNGFPADTWFTTVPNGPSATWTTTVASGNQYVYDRFQLSHSAAWHFTGRWGVLYYADYYDISICEGTANNAGKVDTLSDHYPIWAEFSLDTQTPPP